MVPPGVKAVETDGGGGGTGEQGATLWLENSSQAIDHFPNLFYNQTLVTLPLALDSMYSDSTAGSTEQESGTRPKTSFSDLHHCMNFVISPLFAGMMHYSNDSITWDVPSN